MKALDQKNFLINSLNNEWIKVKINAWYNWVHVHVYISWRYPFYNLCTDRIVEFFASCMYVKCVYFLQLFTEHMLLYMPLYSQTEIPAYRSVEWYGYFIPRKQMWLGFWHTEPVTDMHFSHRYGCIRGISYWTRHPSVNICVRNCIETERGAAVGRIMLFRLGGSL